MHVGAVVEAAITSLNRERSVKMRVEIVAVGTELLLGQVVDTNSTWIAGQLADAGLDVLHTSCVGDNPGRIEAQLRQAVDRADAVIVCGGLGPTQDDLTRDVIADLLGTALVTDQTLADEIAAKFAARGRQMPAINLRQAQLPVGADAIPNPIGTAAGVRAGLAGRVLYAVPGVPVEMRRMITEQVLPDLRRRAEQRGETAVVCSRVLRTWGTSESALAELLAPRIEALDAPASDGRPRPTLAFLASGIEGLKVRLTVRADDLATAGTELAAEEERVRQVIEPWVFGVDDDTMESVLLDLLRARSWRLATAESLTAGYVSGRLAQVPGASDVLVGGVVSYASSVKHDLLGVPAGPVVSEAAALAMAQGAARVLGAEVAVATTGVAGPDSQEGQPVGTVCLAAITPNGERTATVRYSGERETIRQLSVISVLDLARRLVLEC